MLFRRLEKLYLYKLSILEKLNQTYQADADPEIISGTVLLVPIRIGLSSLSNMSALRLNPKTDLIRVFSIINLILLIII